MTGPDDDKLDDIRTAYSARNLCIHQLQPERRTTHVVFAMLEAFFGNGIYRDFDQNRADYLASEGAACLRALNRDEALRVVLVHHGEKWEEAAREIARHTGLAGTALSPVWATQDSAGPLSFREMAGSFGVKPENALLVAECVVPDMRDAETSGLQTHLLWGNIYTRSEAGRLRNAVAGLKAVP